MNTISRVVLWSFLSVAVCVLLAVSANSARAQVSVVQGYGPEQVYAVPVPTTPSYAPAYYGPAPVTSYYAPAPVYYGPQPVVSYYAPAPVYTVPVPVVVRRAYVPFEPVRNVMRARRW